MALNLTRIKVGLRKWTGRGTESGVLKIRPGPTGFGARSQLDLLRRAQRKISPPFLRGGQGG